MLEATAQPDIVVAVDADARVRETPRTPLHTVVHDTVGQGAAVGVAQAQHVRARLVRRPCSTCMAYSGLCLVAVKEVLRVEDDFLARAS